MLLGIAHVLEERLQSEPAPMWFQSFGTYPTGVTTTFNHLKVVVEFNKWSCKEPLKVKKQMLTKVIKKLMVMMMITNDTNTNILVTSFPTTNLMFFSLSKYYSTLCLLKARKRRRINYQNKKYPKFFRLKHLLKMYLPER